MANRKCGSNYLTVCWFLCVFFSTFDPPHRHNPLRTHSCCYSPILIYYTVSLHRSRSNSRRRRHRHRRECIYTLCKHYQMYICSFAKQFSFRRLICIYMPLTWYLFFAFHNMVHSYVCIPDAGIRHILRLIGGLWDAVSEQVCVCVQHWFNVYTSVWGWHSILIPYMVF